MASPLNSLQANTDSDDPNEIIGSQDTSKSHIEFPSGLTNPSTPESGPYMEIIGFEYQRGIRKDTKSTQKFVVRLPLPSNLQQAHQGSYSQFSADAMIDTIVSNEGSTGKKMAQLGSAGIAKEAAMIATRLAGAKLPFLYNFMNMNPDTRNTISSVFGIAMNPRLEVAFNGMQLRTHQYEFQFVPKNQKENEDVQKIIQTFEDAMYPDYVDNTEKIFLEYPFEFVIGFYSAAGNPIKTLLPVPDCFLDGFSTVFNPIGGAGRLHADDSAIAYRIGFSFIEANQLTRKDLQALRGSK